MRIEALCNFSNLLAWTKEKPIDFLVIDDDSNYMDYVRLIKSGLFLKTDVGEDVLNANLNNPFIKYLLFNNKLKSAKDEFSQLQQNEDGYFESDNKGLKVHLLEGIYSNKTQDYSTKSGYYFINKSQENSNFFEPAIENFSFGESKTWVFAKNIFLPHHSIIIADPWLFQENNLNGCLNLLKEIIPKFLKGKYHVTLLVNNIDINKSDKAIRNDLDKLKSIVALHKDHCEIEMHSYNGKDFHDRWIVTNNVIVSMGYSLGIINEKNQVVKKSTWNIYKPFLKNYYNQMNKELRCFEKWIVKSSNPKSLNPLFKIKF